MTLSPDVLDAALLAEIGARGGVRRYPAHAVLVNEGDAGDALYIVLSGRVKAYGSDADGREVIYSVQGPGEYFGEMTLDGGVRSASVATLEASSCVVVAGADVRDFLAHHPDFARHLVTKLIRLARRSTAKVKSLALSDVYGRLAALLRELARAEGEHWVVAEKMTQQDIADRIGASREMVSRIFKQLVTGGYISLAGRRIVLLKTLPARW
jgi:CRP/FNR family cyclic AMP-dependent transcriptional regulator